ncbi:MAG: DUF84 family protein [Candidatus Heimdallarchaeota archaeon]
MKRNKTSVLVTSRNPVKVHATYQAFKQFFPDLVVDATDFQSSDSDRNSIKIQPIGEKETYVNSRKRIRDSQVKTPDYDFFVGVEGGIAETPNGQARIIIYTSVGSATHIETIRGCEIPLPRPWYDELISGKAKELGDVVTEASGIPNIKQKQGAIGFLTSSALTRAAVIEHSIICALIPFLNPEYFTSPHRTP